MVHRNLIRSKMEANNSTLIGIFLKKIYKNLLVNLVKNGQI